MTTIIDKIAWIHIVDGKVLCARSKGKDIYYFPGGKRETGESDIDTLTREIQEELSVLIKHETILHFGNFKAEAHGKEAGVVVRMSCYTGEYDGLISPASEIDEVAWLTYNDRDRVSVVSQMIFDRLYEMKMLK